MRAWVASSLGAGAGIFGFAVGAGVSGSLPAAALVGVASAALTGWLLYGRRMRPLDESASTRGLRIVSAAASLVALVVLARLAVFMVDPSRIDFSFMPGSKWEVEHSCLTAYFISAQAASGTHDIYDDSLFTAPDDDLSKPRKPLMLGPFRIDVFEYPPTFLLLPRALMRLVPDFTRLRMLWFGLSGGIVMVVLLAVVRFLTPAVGTRALLFTPLIWLSLPMLSCLQKENVQVVVIAASMLAMLLFARGRDAAGGAILAFVAMSKIYPGMLVIYLLAQRRWRALAWTVGAGIVLLSVSLLDIGWAPYGSFLHRLPQILGGEAFPAFRNPAAVANNFSIPGLVFKLKALGVPGMSFGISKLVGWAYTVVVVAVTVVVARRSVEKDQMPAVWLAILILATLRSPFLPASYAAIPPLWLLTLLAARVAPAGRVLAITCGLWIVLNVYWPTDWAGDRRLIGLIMLAPLAIMLGLAVAALRRESQDRSPQAP